MGPGRLDCDLPTCLAKTFDEVFLPREAWAAASLAFGVGALVTGFEAAMSVVDSSLATEQTTGVGEAADFSAVGFQGLVSQCWRWTSSLVTAVTIGLGTTMLVVDSSLMAEQTTGVGEAAGFWQPGSKL